MILRLLFILVLACTATPAWAILAGEMRVIGDSDRTRFVVDLEKNPDFGVLRLTNPYRLVIEMKDVSFTGPAKPGEGRGLISDYRYGLIAPGKARIVLDLVGPVTIVSTFVLDPVASEPSRLVVDMVPATAPEFEAAAAVDRAKLDAATPSADVPQSVESGRQVVVIDPGHGGIDSGAIGKDGLLEKDVTLKFGLELARQLKLHSQLEPVLTRDGDDFLALAERVEVAERHRASLFISVHADSVAEDYVRGATVYTLSDEASDEISAALTARENRSDILAGLSLEDQPDEVADILFDFARRETRNFSVRFAEALVKRLDGAVPLNANPWRRGAFRVLKAPDVPSVLLELGYLSNEEDEKLFRSETWPRLEAEATAQAIKAFLGSSVTAGQ